jgi:hypothetical protein
MTELKPEGREEMNALAEKLGISPEKQKELENIGEALAKVCLDDAAGLGSCVGVSKGAQLFNAVANLKLLHDCQDYLSKIFEGAIDENSKQGLAKARVKLAQQWVRLYVSIIERVNEGAFDDGDE